MDVRWQVELDGSTLRGWERLGAADPSASPFASPFWVRAWLQHCGNGARPAFITVWSADELVGVAPLMEERSGRTRLLTGAAQRDSDYWDVVAAPGMHSRVAGAVAREICRRRDRWDIAHLAHVPVDSTTAAELRAAGLRVARVATAPCPVVRLPGSFDEYLASLPKRRRQSVRRSLRRAESGEVEIREVHEGPALDRLLQRWQELRCEQFRGRPVPINPIHLSESYRRFLVAALSEMAPRGSAAVWSVEREGAVVGVYIALRDERTEYAYQGGYDVAVRKLGIGKIVDAVMIRSAIAAGRRAVDFGRGGEPYKYWYGARDRDTATVVCAHGSARSTLAFAARVIPRRMRALARGSRGRARNGSRPRVPV